MFFPAQYGGYGIEDFHLMKVEQQTRYVIQHLRNMDSAEKQIKILMYVHQLRPVKLNIGYGAINSYQNIAILK